MEMLFQYKMYLTGGGEGLGESTPTVCQQHPISSSQQNPSCDRGAVHKRDHHSSLPTPCKAAHRAWLKVRSRQVVEGGAGCTCRGNSLFPNPGGLHALPSPMPHLITTLLRYSVQTRSKHVSYRKSFTPHSNSVVLQAKKLRQVTCPRSQS